MFKTVNIPFVCTSPNKKPQDPISKEGAKRIAPECPDFFGCVFKVDGFLYGADIPKDKILVRYRISGEQAKILSPLTKKQLLVLIAEKKLSVLGSAEQLKKYYNGKYPVSNDGDAVEFLIAQKRHIAFDHKGKMTPKGECGGVEVKFFDFGKTSGMPCATIKKK